MDEETSNLPLNDETDYGLCFACGPRNPSGLRLRFAREGERVTTTFQGREQYQGFPGYLHGGVITALLDEVMSRVSLLEDRWTMTARLDVRFRKPVLVGQEVRAVAEKAGPTGKFLDARGRVELPDGSVAADAVGTYAFVPDESLARMSEGYPQLAREWMAPDRR